MSDKIARYYDEEMNPPQRIAPDGTPEYAYLPGVPLRDLTEDEFQALPAHIQANIDASPLYRKTKPPSAAAPTPAPKSKTTKPKAVPIPRVDIADEPTDAQGEVLPFVEEGPADD